jgi:Ran GTPase-activating protein 1
MALSTPYGRELQTLDARGPRGALTKEKAVAICEPVTSGVKVDFERIIFSTWAYSVESASVFAEAIKQLPKLESAVLADIIAGRPEAEGLAVYRTLAAALASVQLKEIDLSDNAMGLKGVDACRSVLQQQDALERLFFCNCGISAEAARGLADVLLYRPATTLRTLHFDNNMSGGGGAVAVADIVAASPELQDLRFTSSRATREGGAALAAAFLLTPRLTTLNLHDNLFAEVLGVELGRSLPSMPSLLHLDVGDVLLRDKGMAALASGLVRGPAAQLRTLDVSANELTEASAGALARVVRRCISLVSLRAEDNEWGNEGAVTIAARGIAARAVVRAKRGPPGSIEELSTIVLSGCGIGNEGGVAIAAAASLLPSLSMLDVGGNDMDRGGVDRLRALLKTRDTPDIILGDVDAQEEEEGEGEGEGEDGLLPAWVDGEGLGEDDSDVDVEGEGSTSAAVDALAAAVSAL